MAKDRTSASTNRKRRANKRIDQSEASGEQAHRPIRSVGRTSASTNQKSFTKQRRSREGAAQPIRFRLAGSIGGRLVTPEGQTFFGLISFLRILHQVRTTDQPTRSIHRSNSDRLIRTDFLRTNFLSSDSPSSQKRRISQRDPSIGVIRTDYLRTDFLRANFVSSDSSPSENHGSANQIATSE